MNAVYFWTGPRFTLLEYLSVLSTAHHTTFDAIEIFYDETTAPDNAFWHGLDALERVHKRPAARLLEAYFAEHVGAPPAAVANRRVTSDVFRYCHLHRHGGTWLDFDTFQVRDVRSLTDARPFLAGWERPDSVAIGVLSFPPEHPVLAAMLEALRRRLFDPGDQTVWRVGPPLFTEVIERLGLAHAVLPEPYFYPLPWQAREAVLVSDYPVPAETHSIHVWGCVNRTYFVDRTLADFARIESTFFDLARQVWRDPEA